MTATRRLMTRFRTSAVLAVGTALLTLTPGPGEAELCVPDRVPAATLLVPYFEVDPASCGSGNPVGTTVTIQNVTAESVLAHVNLWTNLSIPFTSFTVYLPGHGSHMVDLGRFFCSGYLPSTGSAVSTPGPLAEPNTEFPACNSTTDPANGAPVYGGDGAVPEWFLAPLRDVFMGEPWLDGSCAATPTDSIQGYVTVDVVNQCAFIGPDEPGYFVFPGVGIAANDNVLLGEYAQEDADEVTGDTRGVTRPAVHIEADPTGTLLTAGDETFYGRFVANDASDGREPLPTDWRVRYDPASAVTVWRQVPAPTIAPFVCGSVPFPFPLGRTAEQNFDPDATLWEVEQPPIPPPPPPPFRLIPWATQRIPAGAPETPPYPPPPPDFDQGWTRFLFTTIATNTTGQSWVTVETEGTNDELGHGAVSTDSSCPPGMVVTVQPPAPVTSNPVVVLIFQDGFESGDTSTWTQTTP